MKIKIIVMAVILLMSGPASALGSWGLEVGRANAADVIQKQKDWLNFKQVREQIDRATALKLEVERQRQLLGREGAGLDMEQLYEEIEDFWFNNLLGPLQRIALNPASSCAEAQYVFSQMIQMRRQQQLMGLTESKAIKSVYFAIEGMTNLRCRNEALDECVTTGRFMQIVQLMTGTQRQMQMLGGEGDEESWAEGALRQCAIYELHFVSRSKSSVTLPPPVKRASEIETVRDGRVQIRFHMTPGQLGIKETVSSLGDLLNGENEKSPFFVSVKCQSSHPDVEWICSPHADSSVIQVRINALDLRHREFYIEYEKDKHMFTESEVSRERLVGEDKFSFTFEGGEFHFQVLSKHLKGGTLEVQMENLEGHFYQAHRKDWIAGGTRGDWIVGGNRLKIETTSRGVYPTVFQFTYADKQTSPPGILYTDSTEFELIHKPEPEPFEKVREPIRKPLKPPPGE